MKAKVAAVRLMHVRLIPEFTGSEKTNIPKLVQ